MSKLRDTLEKYISTQNIQEDYRHYVLDKMEEEIVQEVVKQKAKEICDKAKARKEQEEVRQRIKSARAAFWTVLALGLLIELQGNKITELISDAKGTSIGITWLLVIAISVLIYVIYDMEYLRQAENIINEWLKKEQEDDE